MRKLICLVAAPLMMLGLAACDETAEEGAQAPAEPPAVAENPVPGETAPMTPAEEPPPASQ